jgi:hypothetical protein
MKKLNFYSKNYKILSSKAARFEYNSLLQRPTTSFAFNSILEANQVVFINNL